MTMLYRKYEAFQAVPMTTFTEEGRYSYVETVAEERAQFWSVQGRTTEGEWEFVANFEDKSPAVGLAALLMVAHELPGLLSVVHKILPSVEDAVLLGYALDPRDEPWFQEVRQAMKWASELVATLEAWLPFGKP